MDYTLHQLRVFLKVVQHQSITKAASELHLTQPAVSMQLKKFQEQFSIPLTEIIGRKLYVTDFGKEIAVASENILNEVATMNYKTLAYQGQVAGRLTISVVSTGKYVMPYFLSSFIRKNPGVDLTIDVTNKSQVLESLVRNEVDFALVSTLPDRLNIERVELMKNKLYLVIGKDLLPSLTQDQADLFSRFPVIYREKGSATRLVMEDFLLRNSIPVQKKMELTSNEALKQAVIAGLGISIMPIIGIKNELKNGDLHIIPFPDLPIESTWNLIWLKSKKLSPVATAYLEFIRNNRQSIIDEHFRWFEDFK